jgi:hypothetical protein
MQKLAAAVESCEPNSKHSLVALELAAQQKFLQDLQQHKPAQLAAELLTWLQAWPDLPDALLSSDTPNATSRVQVAADLVWRAASRMLMRSLQVVNQRAAAGSMPWLQLLEQLIGPCCTTCAPCFPIGLQASIAQVDWYVRMLAVQSMRTCPKCGRPAQVATAVQCLCT